MANKSIIAKIKRQSALMADEIADMHEYDKIVNMEWAGIPGLKDEEYYVEYIDTTGRDIIQQATNVYAVQRPKWDVIPRGKGDTEVAESMERVIEWYFREAAQMGRKPYHTEAMTHIGKYNKVGGQIEWLDDYKFCVKNYHPASLRYEYGTTLQWVAVVNNLPAVTVIERWQDYATSDWETKVAKGDDIGAALKKIQALVDEDQEQRVMYVDYTDKKKRYTYCYPVDDSSIDDDLGYDDDGELNEEIITIQDKENSLGFINWAIAENEGDPLLAPLLKGKYYDNINDIETMKATNAFRRGLYPMFLQNGREDADADIDFSGAQVVMKAPTGAQITPIIPPPLDPSYNELAAQMRQRMNNSLAVQNVSQTSVSNVQHSTYDAQVKMWLMQFEPNKRTAEKYFEQLASLMFRWAKKKERILRGKRLYTKTGGLEKGTEIEVTPDDINLENLHIKCQIDGNSPTDLMSIVNQITMMKQAGVRIPDSEYIEKLGMGDPEILGEEYEKQEIRTAELQNSIKTIVQEADMAMAKFQSDLQMQAQMMMQQMQQQMAQAQQMQGAEPVQQGQPMPSDQALSGQGFNAGMGGQAPQAANPELTQAQR